GLRDALAGSAPPTGAERLDWPVVDVEPEGEGVSVLLTPSGEAVGHALVVVSGLVETVAPVTTTDGVARIGFVLRPGAEASQVRAALLAPALPGELRVLDAPQQAPTPAVATAQDPEEVVAPPWWWSLLPDAKINLGL